MSGVRLDGDAFFRRVLHLIAGFAGVIAASALGARWVFLGFWGGIVASVILHKSVSLEEGEIVLQTPWRDDEEGSQ